MPKLKTARKSTHIDMTPMVDLAFLLITFFMLTIKFQPEETLKVTTPKSTDPNDVVSASAPDSLTTELLIISADRDGRVFVGVRGGKDREIRKRALARLLSENKGIALDGAASTEFSLLPDIGVKFQALPEFLKLSAADKIAYYNQPNYARIPTDSTDNQLYKYIRYFRESFLQLAQEEDRPQKLIDIMVKADVDTPYPVIRDVVEALRKQRALRFRLVTSKEDFPSNFRSYKAPGSASAEAN